VQWTLWLPHRSNLPLMMMLHLLLLLHCRPLSPLLLLQQMMRQLLRSAAALAVPSCLLAGAAPGSLPCPVAV
jgi:hypothetical protein